MHACLQLYAADDATKEAHHAQELHATVVLHRVLLPYVGHGVETGTEQDQAIPQQDVAG